MKKLILPFVMSLLLALPSQAQEAKAQKYDNTEMMSVVYIKYHPGKMARAREIVREYYQPATEKAGVPGPMLMLDMMTGEWDMIVLWKRDINDLAWRTTENGAKWTNALHEITGGADKAAVIQQEYQSLIAKSSSDMARAQ